MKLAVENAFMKIWSNKFFTLLIVLFAQSIHAQQAVGDWKYHLSYSGGNKLTASSNGSFFALDPNGVYFYSGPAESINEITRLDNLNSQSLKALIFDNSENQLIVAHGDGVIDFISESDITPFFGLRDNDLIREKRINGFSAGEIQIWVSGDFGFAEIDSRNQIFLDSYLNLGDGGDPLGIFSVASNSTQIFIATESDIRVAYLSSNLKDFRSWQVITGSENQTWQTLVINGPAQWAQTESGYIYEFTDSGISQIFGITESLNLKQIENTVFYQQGNQIFELDNSGNFTTRFEADEEPEDFWVSASGLTYLTSNGLQIPGEDPDQIWNGPTGKSLGLAILDEEVISFSTSYSANQETISSDPSSSSWDQVSWESIDSPDSVTALMEWNSQIYWGTSNGLWRSDPDGTLTKLILPNNQNDLPISCFAGDAQGNLWVGVFDQESRLLKVTNEGISSEAVPGLLLPGKIITDLQSRLWIVQENRFGRTLRQYFPESGQSRIYGASDDLGALPNSRVNDITLDDLDRLWLGTESGLAFLPSASLIEESSNVEAIEPVFEGRPVLSNENITSLEILPDKSFALGTRSAGLWRFTENFEELIENFTPTNSPIPDSNILDLVNNTSTGELFTLFPQGIAALRTGIISAEPDLDEIKIFPNPVDPSFTGVLTIEGLTDNSDLLITDTAGRPVYRRAINGGSITWDLQDGSGSRIGTGIYLVYILDSDGNQRARGKFLVI